MRDLAREDLIAELQALRPLFEKEGVTGMAMFGSRSRGDHRPDSDVDLLIDVASDRDFSLLDVAGVGHIIEDNLGLESSIVIREDASDKFIRRIARDIVPVFLWTGSPPLDLRISRSGSVISATCFRPNPMRNWYATSTQGRHSNASLK